MIPLSQKVSASNVDQGPQPANQCPLPAANLMEADGSPLIIPRAPLVFSALEASKELNHAAGHSHFELSFE